MTDEQRNVEHGKLLTILQGYKSDVDELNRMIRAEIARNDKMRAQIAALRNQWEERRAAWNLRHTQIVTRETVPAIIEAALANRIYAITGAIEDLNALFPPDASA